MKFVQTRICRSHNTKKKAKKDLSYNRAHCYRVTNIPFILQVFFSSSSLHSYWNFLLAFHQIHVENRTKWIWRVGIPKYLWWCDFNLLRELSVFCSTKSRINCDRMHVAGKLIEMSLSTPVCGVRRSFIFTTENWTWTIIWSTHDWHWLSERVSERFWNYLLFLFNCLDRLWTNMTNCTHRVNKLRLIPISISNHYGVWTVFFCLKSFEYPISSFESDRLTLTTMRCVVCLTL